MNPESNQPETTDHKFDDYAQNYDAALAQGLSVTGESKEYFARGRLEWLRGYLQKSGITPRCVLDFGCGTGSATPYFFEVLDVQKVIGVDVSPRSLEVARNTWSTYRHAHFLSIQEFNEWNTVDLVFCNGVFHHIPIAERAEAIAFIHRSLRPGGCFALWENNPWNPGTRWVMGRCPFDDDVITLSPPQARHLVQNGGLKLARTDFLFLFPRALKYFRPLEARLSSWPLGAQYQVLSRKP